MSKSKVLFIMTGSIACYKACHVISRLVQAQCDVQVVATPSALQFVGNATLEGLTGKPVVSDLYHQGNVMDHIHLMRWADIVIVAPATANFINKAAQGIGDDLVGTLFLAHDFKKPFLLAPAMNTSMYLHPATQSSITKLRDMGIEILEAASGVLACGEEGYGKLLEPDLILKEIFARLSAPKTPDTSAATHTKNSDFAKIKVLVTAGGTQEPVDTVRTITNLSSGRTGIQIAEYLSLMGIDVTLVQAHGTAKSDRVKKRATFTSFSSLDSTLQEALKSDAYTHVIHAAAVSDYSVDSIEAGGEKYKPLEKKKISSDLDSMTIHLKRNHKIVDRLKTYSQNPDLKVVAFKLTSHASPEERAAAVKKLFTGSHADYVVHNDLLDIDIVKRTHKFTVYGKETSKPCDNLEQLCGVLTEIVLQKDFV
jgi:phosphopantothenoylcysteine decarboxylase/phosphopantothenate--cysteine ligase, prokaryotic